MKKPIIHHAPPAFARTFFCLAWMGCLVASCAHAAAQYKEKSLVTGEDIGELAVAGRLSVELHAEFMLSRSWETNSALNWYSMGYSGGGAGGTNVGGNFGHFGFQVSFQEREKKYPHAVTQGGVSAVHFDGNDFLQSNTVIEKKILDAGSMAVEIWFRSESPAAGEVILGWQSIDGRDGSAPLGYPPRFTGSDRWRHMVVNCTSERESWYLDGIRVSDGPRRTLVSEGHSMILGGTTSRNPSFKGDLAAVRLHDDAMTAGEITHNFNGGVGLGTKIHAWWRTEPDKWWVAESEHFRHCVDKEEMKAWTKQQREDFEKRVPGMFELAEKAYDLYSERLALRTSVVSVKPEERGDGIKYNIPIQPNQGNVMGFDGSFGWSCQEAGFINPHELVHGWQVMTGNMAGNFWESHANFPQTYLGIYQTIPVFMTESSAFPANGRTYYHDRLMFEHLAQTPEYGPMFISKLWYDGPTADVGSPYPWITFEGLNPYADRSLADEYVRMAMRNITWDYQLYKEFKTGGGGSSNEWIPEPAEENLYRKVADERTNETEQGLLRARVLLEPIVYQPGWWRVPKEQAPMQLGWNICPLEFKPGRVSATLAGYVDAKRGGDWRAGFVAVNGKGDPVYGEVFGPGTEQEFNVAADTVELYLVVCATPSKIVDIPMTGDFRSFEQEPFPYRVMLKSCRPLDVLLKARTDVTGSRHKNGGGLVEASAEVDATAYVGPDARVMGRSKVLGDARIEGHAVILDSTVMDNAVVSDHALVFDDSKVAGHAKIRDFAVVKGKTTVTGRAKILEHAAISTQKTCSDQVTVKGIASVYGGNQSGSAMIDGFYAKGNEITKGKWFSWSWGQGKNPGEEDENFGGLYADYDFNTSHGWMARDAFGATWGYLVNGARTESRQGGDSKSQDDGVLRLDGRDQFVELPRDIADMSECTYTVEVMWDGAGEGVRIFDFSNDSGDSVCLTPSANNRMVYAIRKGSQVESVSAPALRKGVWTTIQVMHEGDRASLYVNGAKAAEKKGMTLRPDSIRAEHCYLGRGSKGDFLGGLLGRFTVHSVALVDQSPPTPNPPAFEQEPMFSSPGSVVMTAGVGSDPLGIVEYWFEEEGRGWNSGWTSERKVFLEKRDVSRPRHYRFKMRDKGGNETSYSDPVRAGGFPASERVVQVASGVPAVIEAEQMRESIPSAASGEKWEKQSDVAGFVGEGYMAVPDGGRVNEPFSADAARLDYALNFMKAGKYFLWVRANGNNDGGATIHAGLDLNVQPWGTRLRTGSGRYAWTRSPVIEIERAGNYLFSIWMCDDGAMVDRLLFSDNKAYVPGDDNRAPDGVPIGEGPPGQPERTRK